MLVGVSVVDVVALVIAVGIVVVITPGVVTSASMDVVVAWAVVLEGKVDAAVVAHTTQEQDHSGLGHAVWQDKKVSETTQAQMNSIF